MVQMKLYIWRTTKIFVAFADNITNARAYIFKFDEHMTKDEIDYVSEEPDQIIKDNYAELFPGCD